MSFTDGKPKYATEEDLKAKWSGRKDNSHFRCYLCGHKFILGDYWRFVNSKSSTFIDIFGKTWGVGNALTCEKCDGPDILERWVKMHEEAYNRFWFFTCQENYIEVYNEY